MFKVLFQNVPPKKSMGNAQTHVEPSTKPTGGDTMGNHCSRGLSHTFPRPVAGPSAFGSSLSRHNVTASLQKRTR